MVPSVLKDFAVSGTPLRGLVVHSGFCLCAYVGVPRDHWLAGMDELEFDCHFGVTFRGEGDGFLRPQDWYWYGWDYGHFTDHIELPGELPQEILDLWDSMRRRHGAKRWTVEELEHDIVDVAVNLMAALERAATVSSGVVQRLVDSSAAPVEPKSKSSSKD